MGISGLRLCLCMRSCLCVCCVLHQVRAIMRNVILPEQMECHTHICPGKDVFGSGVGNLAQARCPRRPCIKRSQNTKMNAAPTESRVGLSLRQGVDALLPSPRCDDGRSGAVTWSIAASRSRNCASSVLSCMPPASTLLYRLLAPDMTRIATEERPQLQSIASYRYMYACT